MAKFRTELHLSGKTSTGIRIPDKVVEGLGSGKRPAVNATINGYTYRTTVAPMGGEFWIPVSAEIRKAAGVAAGDELGVELTLDTKPREVTVPDDLSAALDGVPEAKKFFEGLSYSNKRRIVLQVEGAKTTETRQRRIDKAVTSLSEGKV